MGYRGASDDVGSFSGNNAPSLAILQSGKGANRKDPKAKMDEEKKSVHRRFIEFLMGYDFRVKDGNLIIWAGNHWASLSHEVSGPTLSAYTTMNDFVRNCRSSGRLAIEWLWESGSLDPKRDSFAGDLAEKILGSAIMKLPSAPKPSKNPIIPCSNGWLEAISANGELASGGRRARLAVRKPDKEIGVFHALDVALPEGIRAYEPQPLPPQSEFFQFIQAVQPDPVQRQAVQEFCGYVLVANDSATEQKHQLWMGSDDGRNGKGTMIDILSKGFLSKDAWTAYDISKIDDKFANAALAGKALAIVDETPKAIKSPGKLKSMLGEGVVVVEKKFKDPISIQLRTRWIFLSNHWPKATEGDRALWNRFQFIEWGVEIPEDKRKKGLAESLIQNEKGVIFDFFMAGILSYLDRGRLMDLESSNAIRKAVILSGDPVAEWLEESGAFLSMTTTAPKDEIYEDFFERARRQGHPTPLGATGFWPRIKALLKKNEDPSQRDLMEPPRSGRGGDRRQRSNLVLPKHSPEEAALLEGVAPEPCPFAPAPADPGEAENAALQRWLAANPQGCEGSYRPEWDALLPHAKALFRESVAEGVGREGVAARMAAKIRVLGGCPPAEMEAARHGFVETLLD